MPQNFYLDIINPEDPKGPKVKAEFPNHFFSKLYKFSPTAYQNLIAAKFVLENPLRIFSGTRELEPGGWCFAGRPKSWYTSENTKAAFPRDLVFAVYMNPRFAVYAARAEKSSLDDIDSPVDWEDRYASLIWKSTF